MTGNTNVGPFGTVRVSDHGRGLRHDSQRERCLRHAASTPSARVSSTPPSSAVAPTTSATRSPSTPRRSGRSWRLHRHCRLPVANDAGAFDITHNGGIDAFVTGMQRRRQRPRQLHLPRRAAPAMTTASRSPSTPPMRRSWPATRRPTNFPTTPEPSTPPTTASTMCLSPRSPQYPRGADGDHRRGQRDHPDHGDVERDGESEWEQHERPVRVRVTTAYGATTRYSARRGHAAVTIRRRRHRQSHLRHALSFPRNGHRREWHVERPRRQTFTTAACNTAPTITEYRGSGHDAGHGAPPLAFTMATTPARPASALSGSSSNQTLVPNANIVFSGKARTGRDGHADQ